MLIIGGSNLPGVHREPRYARKPPEEVAQLSEGHRRLTPEELNQVILPATAEDLADTEEFLAYLRGERPEYGRSVRISEEAA